MSGFFNDAADVRTILPQVDASADDMLQYIEDAEETFMVDFLSEAYYDELVAAIDTAGYDISALTAAQQTVVKPLRKAAAYYGFHEAMPFLNTHLSNSGARHADNEGTGQLRKWEYDESKYEAILKADRFLDKALKILEAAPGTYATWAGSAAFTAS